jgi:hypothetical protein
MKESIKTQPEVMIVVGQVRAQALQKTIKELAGLLGVEQVVEKELSEPLQGTNQGTIQTEKTLFVGLYSEWKENSSLWPTVDGRTVYLGLLAEERPASQELFEALDKSVSFILLKELPLLAQVEAFSDLFS